MTVRFKGVCLLFLLAVLPQWKNVEAADDCPEAIKPSNSIEGCEWKEGTDSKGCKTYNIKCSDAAKIDKGCLLDAEYGPCAAHITKYYYNARNGKCSPFVYSGCTPNANNFDTSDDCTSVCIDNEPRKKPVVSHAVSESDSLKCTKVNEKFYDCGACDSKCGSTTKTVCSLICRPAECGCIDGYLRNSAGVCVAPEKCKEPIKSANIDPNAGDSDDETQKPTVKTTIQPTTLATTRVSTTTLKPTTRVSTTTLKPTTWTSTRLSTTTLMPTTKVSSTTLRPTTKVSSTSTVRTSTTLRPTTWTSTRLSTTTLMPTTRVSSTSTVRTSTTLRPTTWISTRLSTVNASSTTLRPTTRTSTINASSILNNILNGKPLSTKPPTFTLHPLTYKTSPPSNLKSSKKPLCSLITCPSNYTCEKGTCIPPDGSTCDSLKIAVAANGCKTAFRNNSNGCAVPYLVCSNVTCGENEEAKICGACDGTCGSPACIRDETRCKPVSCGCYAGYVRDKANKCVKKSMCNNIKTTKKSFSKKPNVEASITVGSTLASTIASSSTAPPAFTLPSVNASSSPPSLYNFQSKVLNSVYLGPGPVRMAAT